MTPIHIIAHHLARRGMIASLRTAMSLFFEDLLPWLLSLLQEIPAHLSPSQYQWLLPLPTPTPSNAISLSNSHREVSVLWEGSVCLLYDVMTSEHAENELATSALAADILTMAGVSLGQIDQPIHDISLSSSLLAQWYIVRTLQLEQMGQTASATELAHLGLERCLYSSQKEEDADSSQGTDMEVSNALSTYSLIPYTLSALPRSHPINTRLLTYPTNTSFPLTPQQHTRQSMCYTNCHCNYRCIRGCFMQV